MEERMKKYRQVSPERAKVWTERSPKYQQNRKVPVVYYLSRNQQLEHPHFIEVPISSSDGLYLRDVIDKLNVLRGRGMASLYSWSCKRSYKSGYVWHDLSEDDLILPAHGSEYVLKGSELFEDSNSGHLVPVKNTRSPIPKQLPEPVSSISQDESPSSTSMSGRETMLSQDNELSPPVEPPESRDERRETFFIASSVSPESSDEKHSSSDDSLSLTEYKVYKSNGLANASTQTESTMTKDSEAKETYTIGISTDNGSLGPENNDTHENSAPTPQDNSGLCRDSISPLFSSSSPSSAGKTESLEALIRADVKKLSSLRVLEEGESLISSNTKLKASSMLMQLISCGSISVKDHSFGLIPNYRPSFAQSKFPSPLFSTSIMLGELEKRLENKEYFSGSLVETNMLKGVGVNALKRSSSFNADRGGKQLESVLSKEETNSSSSKCIPLPIKASLSKQPRSESMRSPVSEGPKISTERVESSRTISPCVSNGGSKRISEPSSEKKQLKKLDSFREENDHVIKIEES